MQSASKTKAQTGLPQGASLAGPTCVTCDRNRCRKVPNWASRFDWVGDDIEKASGTEPRGGCNL